MKSITKVLFGLAAFLVICCGILWVNNFSMIAQWKPGIASSSYRGIFDVRWLNATLVDVTTVSTLIPLIAAVYLTYGLRRTLLPHDDLANSLFPFPEHLLSVVGMMGLFGTLVGLILVFNRMQEVNLEVLGVGIKTSLYSSAVAFLFIILALAVFRPGMQSLYNNLSAYEASEKIYQSDPLEELCDNAQAAANALGGAEVKFGDLIEKGAECATALEKVAQGAGASQWESISQLLERISQTQENVLAVSENQKAASETLLENVKSIHSVHSDLKSTVAGLQEVLSQQQTELAAERRAREQANEQNKDLAALLAEERARRDRFMEDVNSLAHRINGASQRQGEKQ